MASFVSCSKDNYSNYATENHNFLMSSRLVSLDKLPRKRSRSDKVSQVVKDVLLSGREIKRSYMRITPYIIPYQVSVNGFESSVPRYRSINTDPTYPNDDAYNYCAAWNNTWRTDGTMGNPYTPYGVFGDARTGSQVREVRLDINLVLEMYKFWSNKNYMLQNVRILIVRENVAIRPFSPSLKFAPPITDVLQLSRNFSGTWGSRELLHALPDLGHKRFSVLYDQIHTLRAVDVGREVAADGVEHYKNIVQKFVHISLDLDRVITYLEHPPAGGGDFRNPTFNYPADGAIWMYALNSSIAIVPDKEERVYLNGSSAFYFQDM